MPALEFPAVDSNQNKEIPVRTGFSRQGRNYAKMQNLPGNRGIQGTKWPICVLQIVLSTVLFSYR
jgi:hypothetical protein